MKRKYIGCLLVSLIVMGVLGCSSMRHTDTAKSKVADGAGNITVINDFDNKFEQSDDNYDVGEYTVEESIKDSSISAEAAPNGEEDTNGSMDNELLSEDGFSISEIDDDIFGRIYGKSFKENCSLNKDELRILYLLYMGFDGKSHEGEMIVNAHIAEKVLDIFRQLYEAGYQIEKIRLVDEYDADDESSMADNNSSAFNFRFISYTTTISKHGLGMAIDINPLYNPYVKEVNGKTDVEPANAVDYVDRNRDFDHKIDEDDLAYRLFTENGFEWGGSWKNSKDYQHFEVSTEDIRRIYPEY